MKKILLLLATLLILNVVSAQNVAINNSGDGADPKAILDLAATDKGFLMPRVVLNSTTDPISGTKPTGLLVYNNGGSFGNNGFYYWSGSTWVQLGLPAGTTGQTLRHNGSNWVANSILYNDGTNVGVGSTSPKALLNVYDANESATQTNFTQSLSDAGMVITTDYYNGAYTPGLFWNTQNDNSSKPKAGIYLYENSGGTKMYLATSTDYTVGITNNGLVIDDMGNIGIGTTAPSAALHINGNTYMEGNLTVGAKTAVSGDFRMMVKNDVNKDGLIIKAGDNLGDIGLRIQNLDGSKNILDVEIDLGFFIFGKTYATAKADNGSVYGIDNQNNGGDNADINTQYGVYRMAGTPITPYNIGGGLVSNEVSSSTSTSTTSSSYTQVNSMSSTPAAGTYMVSFAASGKGTADNQEMQVILYKNGSSITHTERDYGFEADANNNDKRFAIHTQALITVNGSEAIEARYKTNTGTFNIYERSMTLLKVSN